MGIAERFGIRKVWPVLVSAGSAMCMLIAFFIPSIQDQWDRYESRQVIQQYVSIGDEFNKEENYKMAEQAFAKAFELSEQKRLDIEMKRLHAKVNLIYTDPLWGSEPPDGLEEVDFQILLHLQKDKLRPNERASILTSYGIYLSSLNRNSEAEKYIREALVLNPKEVLAYINLGNLLDQTGRKKEAEAAYLKALELNPGNVRAHYDLGLLFIEEERIKEAEKEFNTVVELDPADSDAIEQLYLISHP